MANRITTGSVHVLTRVICIPLMILIGIIQAVGTVLTAMSAVILKTISVVMLFITLLLLLFGLLPWMKVLVIILIAGVFMETSSAIIILTPVFLPLIESLGVSTLHFGILFVVGIAIGMITPPVAINLFVATGITGLPIEKIAKAVLPYLVGLIAVFLLIVFVPLIIPGLM